jgi:hypothetical protein
VVVEELLDRARRIELDPARPPRYVPSLFVRRHAALALRAVQAPRVRPRRPGSAR